MYEPSVVLVPVPATPVSPLPYITDIPIIPSCKFWKSKKDLITNISHFTVLPTLPLCISERNRRFILAVGNGDNIRRFNDATGLGPYWAASIINCIERLHFRGSPYHRSHLAQYLDIYHPGKEVHDFEVRPKMRTIDYSPVWDHLHRNTMHRLHQANCWIHWLYSIEVC